MKGQNKKINIGMIGLGYIGTEVLRLIKRKRSFIEKKIGKYLDVVKVAEKYLENKKDITSAFKDITFTDDPFQVIEDEDIDIVVELIGGIDPAFDYIIKSLENRKFVVTANKDLIAKKGAQLFDTAEKNDVDILFEASVGGGIPIIGPLKTTLAANNISKVVGIVNGTTNYILTRMELDGLGFEQALKIAQELGYAESNPDSDVLGKDAANKLAILASIIFNSRVSVDDVYKEGIVDITKEDIKNASELGYCIKLLAVGTLEGKKINVRVHPALVPKRHILSSIKYENNAVYFYGDNVGEVMSFGKGAGDKPTASSVVGDIISIARNYDRAEPKPVFGCTCFTQRQIIPIDDTVSKFYVLMEVLDKPGVLAKISKVFGDHSVSIHSMVQKPSIKERKGAASLVFILHDVINRNIKRSLEEIQRLDVVKQVKNVIRVEELENN